MSAQPSETLLPLIIDSPCQAASPQPVAVGIPFPREALKYPDTLGLRNDRGDEIPVQALPLVRWPDGSVKWLLLDFLLTSVSQGSARWEVVRRAEARRPSPHTLQIHESSQEVVVNTGTAIFYLNRKLLQPFAQVSVNGRDMLDGASSRIVLTDPHGGHGAPQIDRLTVEAAGPVRATVRFEGTFTGRVRSRFVARLSFFAGTGLAQLRLTLHNPQAARHPGGLWDLGDPGSTLFRDLSLELRLKSTAPVYRMWRTEPAAPVRSSEGGALEIYQDSSGGENWRSVTHVNRQNQVPCSFRGYRVRADGREDLGLRASPRLLVQGQDGCVSVAVPEFWQQFPKAIEAEEQLVRVRLFPQQFADLFELQGGEQKTHTVWFQFDAEAGRADLPLDWVHQPAHVRALPEWYAASGVLMPFVTAAVAADSPLGILLHEATSPQGGLVARREIIDEYGWRNFGEIYADHEGRHYPGPPPVISHYNNQYDTVFGALLHYLRTGAKEWLEIAGPLARHVIDIDIYHTNKDKAAYSGGLFWHTDHYKTAATCTHRTYSRANCRPGDRSYGGGPGAAHNYTTGLLHYYFLTGDPDAREAVIGLAEWVLAMDDGRRNILGLVDDGPTGLASSTVDLAYQGPGRGGGNSVNALLDAWIITGRRTYLENAERLIRRCVHPADDVAAHDLLNAELRWSYTVFLSALARYLRLKADSDELDFGYAYARASLLTYARWMVENEVPYLDHPEKLEYPTEVWAAQDLRKANVLRLAAAHADETLRARLLRRGDELADRAWSDLCRFESRAVARAVAIVLKEGLQDLAFRVEGVAAAPAAVGAYDFGSPTRFVPQKLRVRNQLKSVRGLCRAILRLANPRNWLRHVRGEVETR